MYDRRADAGTDAIFWNPESGELDRDSLSGLDAVVHLAGENLAAGRWTEKRKSRILSSRVKGTHLLATELAAMNRPPSVLISASAVGFYGDTGEQPVSEDADSGKLFVSRVCRDWEAAAQPAVAAGIRVVFPRLGVVLTPAGGALARMLTPFRLGMGGRIGNGRQYMSWITVDDLVRVITRALVDPSLTGPVNAVSPGSVTNDTFTRTLARTLERPAVLPVPAPAVRFLFGQMGREVLLAGSRVSPVVLTRAGYPFLHPDLESALRHLLGRPMAS